jgi:UDP-N-acetylglucosamine acyltransferase
MVSIHPTAIVSEKASIGKGCFIGPYSIVGANVSLDENVKLHSHVVIEGHTTIGANTEIFPFASIGHKPQDLKYKGEPSTVEIGSDNTIREYVTIQPGTLGGGMRTVVGDKNLFMANSHMGHDSYVGSGNVIANSVAIAGHVVIGNRVTIGGLAGIHQFVTLSDYCMIGAGAMVTQDIPPACIAQGDRAEIFGINTIGLKRADLNDDTVAQIKALYRYLFLRPGAIKEKLSNVKNEIEGPYHPLFEQTIEFISSSKRGVAPAHNTKV